MTQETRSILKRKAEEGDRLAKPKNVRFGAWVPARETEEDAEMSDAPTTYDTMKAQSKAYWAKEDARIKKACDEADRRTHRSRTQTVQQARPTEIKPTEPALDFREELESLTSESDAGEAARGYHSLPQLIDDAEESGGKELPV